MSKTSPLTVGWITTTFLKEKHPICFRTSAFVGHNMSGFSDFVDCSAEDITLSGFHNLAAFVGYDGANTVDEYCFKDCSVKNYNFTFSYCVSASYTIDQQQKFVSVFYNASNRSDSINFVADEGNTYTGVTYYDRSNDDEAYYPENFRSWSREEAGV